MQLNTILTIVTLSLAVMTGWAQTKTTVFSENFGAFGPNQSLLSGGDCSTLENYFAGVVPMVNLGGAQQMRYQALQFKGDFTKQDAGSLSMIFNEGAGFPYETNADPVLYGVATLPNWFGGNTSTNLCDYTLTFDIAVGGVGLRAVHIALNGVDTGTDSGYMAIDTSEVTPNTGFHAVTANLGNFPASQLDPASQQFEVTITMKGADLAACGPVNDETVTVENLALSMANQIQTKANQIQTNATVVATSPNSFLLCGKSKTPIKEGTKIQQGDTVITGSGPVDSAFVGIAGINLVELIGLNLIRVEPDSQVTFDDLDTSATQCDTANPNFTLAKGSLLVSAETPINVAGIGPYQADITAGSVVMMNTDGNVIVIDGSVSLNYPGNRGPCRTINAGFSIYANAEGGLTGEWIVPPVIVAAFTAEVEAEATEAEKAGFPPQ